MTLILSSNPDSTTYFLISFEVLNLSRLPLIRLCWLKEVQHAKPSARGLVYGIQSICDATVISSTPPPSHPLCLHYIWNVLPSQHLWHFPTLLCLQMHLQTVSSTRVGFTLYSQYQACTHTHTTVFTNICWTSEWMNILITFTSYFYIILILETFSRCWYRWITWLG